MNLDDLVRRLRGASTKKSLRQLGRECDVSHELIRKLIIGGGKSGITVASYNKIDEGLRKHGI